jgi:hypothetical protein
MMVRRDDLFFGRFENQRSNPCRVPSDIGIYMPVSSADCISQPFTAANPVATTDRMMHSRLVSQTPLRLLNYWIVGNRNKALGKAISERRGCVRRVEP